MKLTRRILCSIGPATAALMILFLAAGTTSRAANPQPAPVSTFKLSLSEEGVLIVDAARVKLSDLPGKLKSLGVKPETVLLITVPEATSSNTLKTITTELGTKGYRRLMFTKPRHAVAIVGTNAVSR